jgi:hypothetical protein
MKVAVGAVVAHYTAAILWGNGRLSCKSLYPAASFVRGMGRIKPTERARKRRSRASTIARSSSP